MTTKIKMMFQGCLLEEARSIAEHTALRGSGRVELSAAGRTLEEQAIRLAVIASIRHDYTRSLSEITIQNVALSKVASALKMLLWSCYPA